ncbi:DinB family protein [Saccharomonospora saliphila]|uniref:DinB family protein n=1 Tax=Saccharomonospora saliphila TaxID=369829 RepID=UPI0003718F01|nr:DinB family protein [Saccharomonospora saliphila]
MDLPFPEPTEPRESRAEVFLGYLDYFRSVLIDKLHGLSDSELRTSRLPSGWTPLALLKHLTYVELRWLVWGFEGEPIDQPWGDAPRGRWSTAENETVAGLIDALRDQAARSNQIVRDHELSDVGQPGERWAEAPPATLERVLFHLLQEYARHVGHLDIVRELIDGKTGE